jgi:hypothetical protein
LSHLSTRGLSLLQGLPAISATPTTSTISIAHKHWAGVSAALINLNGERIIARWVACALDLAGIAVCATFVTTKLTKAQQRGPHQ